MDIDQLLTAAVERNASDLHISAGLPPMVRIDGDLERVDHPPVEQQEVVSMLHAIMDNCEKIAGALSCSSVNTWLGMVRNAAPTPRLWVNALTRNRARSSMA